MTDNAQLQQFIEQYEQLAAEKADLSERQKEIMAEARAHGYDVKAIKAVIGIRKLRPEQRDELDALVTLYRGELGV